MATAVELDNSQTGDYDRTRHELSPPLRVPGVAGGPVWRRGLATRYDKTPASYVAGLRLASRAVATVHARPGGGVQSSEERHAGRFLLALGETGTGGGDAGRRVHLVCAHCGSGIGVRCDHLDVAALFAQGLDLAC
jgi:hypothetical protein